MAAYLFAVSDSRGHEVRLTENCYRLHIFLEYPEFIDVNYIADTITSPALITQDTVDPQRLVYYWTYQAQPQRWMKLSWNKERWLRHTG